MSDGILLTGEVLRQKWNIFAALAGIPDDERLKLSNVNDKKPLEPCPSQCDVLKAVSTIGRYISDLNDPIACKIEALLGSFNMQLCLDETRSMKNTVLTDFFQRA
jgi:hypothetical protein